MKTPTRILSTLLCTLLLTLCGLGAPARAAERQWAEISLFDEAQKCYQAAEARQVIHILLDGEELAGDVPAFLMEERTLFPLRLVAEALGAEVEWQSKTRRAVVQRGETQIIFTIGSPVALVNGVETILPDGVGPCLAAALGGERTMVPLRFLAESLDLRVEWEDAARTVRLTAENWQIGRAHV